MEETLIENLHHLSTRSMSILVEKLEIYHLINIYDEYWVDDFIDHKSFNFQNEILKAPKDKINVILKNFDTALETQCNNIIDLSNISLYDNFSYRINHVPNETNISKKFNILEIIPSDKELFKIYWLKHFLNDLSKIAWNIRSILNIPHKKVVQPVNILELINESETAFKELKETTIDLFSSNNTTDEMLTNYYKQILPTYVERIDYTFFHLEVMMNDFQSKFGYMLEENRKFEKIVLNFKDNFYAELNKLFDMIEPNYTLSFLSHFKNQIITLKQKKEIREESLSNYTTILKERIENLILAFNLNQVPVTLPKDIKNKEVSKITSFKLQNPLGYDNIKDLYLSLKSYGLISENTSSANFKNLFSEKEVDQKIIWTGNVSELSFFIKTLHNTVKKVNDTKQKQWDITIKYFEMSDGSVLTKDKLRGQKEPAQSELIVKIVNLL